MTSPAQTNMVKQQVRTWGVTNPAVIHLLEQIPREHFVPADYQPMAYAEINIPLAHQQIMLAPSIIGRLLQHLTIKGTDKICQIGTGSGYLTALLARLGHYVYSVDCHPEFNQSAKQKCSALGVSNVNFVDADGIRGLAEFAPFDVMVITGSLLHIPNTLPGQMAHGGRLFAFLGEAPRMHATLITQVSAGKWQCEQLFETCIPALANAPAAEPFIF